MNTGGESLLPHPLSSHNEAAAAALLPLIRTSLRRREIDSAREQFLRLPQLDRLHKNWLEDVLRDVYSAGHFDINTVLSFLESLANWHWALDGCRVLHRVNTTLGSLGIDILHMPTLTLAFFLRKVIEHPNANDAKVRAEIYWSSWVSPTLRAIVTGEPVIITSNMRREVVYAPADCYAYDGARRNIFSWRQPWTPDGSKNHWLLVPPGSVETETATICDRVYMKNVQFDEYMYAADHKKPPSNERGTTRSRVFGWRKKEEAVGDMGHWQLVPIDPTDRSLFAVYNPYQKEYLCSPSDVYDGERRFVFTAAHDTSNLSWLEERKWRITPLKYSSLEQGIEAFFTKRYAEAVALLTTALEESSDQGKCYVYRIAANFNLGKNDPIPADFDSIEAISDHKPLFHILFQLCPELRYTRVN